MGREKSEKSSGNIPRYFSIVDMHRSTTNIRSPCATTTLLASNMNMNNNHNFPPTKHVDGESDAGINRRRCIVFRKFCFSLQINYLTKLPRRIEIE